MERLYIPRKQEITKIIESVDNLEEKIKIELLNTIDNEYKNKYELNRFRILYLDVKPNPRTPYLGLNLNDISEKNSIILVKGNTGSGKTTTFDKIHHFFCDYKKDKSTIKRLKTDLEIILQEINTKIVYRVLYDSRSGFNGKRFKIFKTVLDEDGVASLEESIHNPQNFLKKKMLIDYDLNETMFVPEISDNSFVSKYCVDEGQFRKLFRISVLRQLFIIIEKLGNEIKKKISELEFMKKSKSNIIINFDSRIEYLKTNFERNIFLIENKDKYFQAKKIYEKIDNILKIKEKKTISKLRSLKKKIKDLRIKIKEIDRLNIKNADNIEDIIYNLDLRQCWKCDTIIPRESFGERLKLATCYVCGIGNFDYSLYYNIFPENNVDELKSRRDSLQNELSMTMQEIDDTYATSEEIIEKPEDINDKIWRVIKYIDSLNEEISNAENENEKIKIQLNEIKLLKMQVLTKIEKNNKDIIDSNKKINSSKILETKLIQFENQQYSKFRDEIFSMTNNLLHTILNERIGSLNFNEDNKLVLSQSYYRDPKKKSIWGKDRLYIEARNHLSTGTLRSIDLSFALAFFFFNRKYLIRPLNFLIIDGLNFFDLEKIEMIYRDLAKENTNYNILIFSNNRPLIFKTDNYQYKELKYNPLMVESPLKQESLDKFLL